MVAIMPVMPVMMPIVIPAIVHLLNLARLLGDSDLDRAEHG
jgi:hypothetical protein